MEEIWKPIRNHENFYLVSNLGRVKRLSTVSKRKDGKNYKRPEKILKPYKNKKGYLMVDLDNNCKGQIIHRLVAEAFIPNPDNLSIVNHINGNKTDNYYLNLEWCTYSYNIKHAHNNNLIKSDKAIKTMQEQNKKQVYCLEQLTLYRCLSDINKKFGYNNGYISTCCNGKKENAYGLHWYYIDDLLKKMKYIKL